MPADPLLVGVTGGIGAGKSTVCKLFSILNVPVYSADDRAKKLMEDNPQLVRSVRHAFGEEAYFADGKLNREYLARTVFPEKQKVDQLNSLVHPVVREDFGKWVQDESAGQSRYLIKETALLFETGSFRELDYTIVVVAPQEERIKRVALRDRHRTLGQITQIIDRQMPDSEKVRDADFVVRNDNKHLLIPQVLEIHQILVGKTFFS